MAVDVEVQQLIRRPPAEVAAFVMDPANDREYVNEIVEHEPPHRLAIRSVKAPRERRLGVRVVATHTWGRGGDR